MTDISSASGRYAIRIADPENPDVIKGYVFAVEESFVEAPGADDVAKDAIAGLEATFAAGSVLDAVLLPSDSHDKLRAMARPGSAGPPR